MKLQEIRAIAKQRQINSSGLSKSELIHKIQQQEGNFDCFGTACNGECDRMDCMWREDCIGAIAA